MRMLDYFSVNDTAVANEFPRSNFILTMDRRPLVTTSSSETHLVVTSYYDMRRRLDEWGFEMGLQNAVFLDLEETETSQGNSLCKGVFGVAVKTAALPADSPISIEKIRDDVGNSLGGQFVDLRRAMLTMREERDRNRLAKFHTLSRWSSTYLRCPQCASSLKQRLSKTAAECLQCRRTFYPTLSPVAITLVHNPNNTRALLVRHKGSVPGVYTCVAGFAVAGESLEQTVQREVAEEVGIYCSRARSLGLSQHWPMPDSSLMCAFFAEADVEQKLQISPDEIETARWFTREEVSAAFDRTVSDVFLKELPSSKEEKATFKYIPPPGAIAHQIIKTWLRGSEPTTK